MTNNRKIEKIKLENGEEVSLESAVDLLKRTREEVKEKKEKYKETIGAFEKIVDQTIDGFTLGEIIDKLYWNRKSLKKFKENLDKKFIGEKTKLSIILYVFNNDERLCNCLNSLIVQTKLEMEIICVDDGSTDDSIKIIENYQKYDRRIKLIKLSNRGMAFAYNIGIEESKSPYIIFLSTKDELEKDLLQDFCEITEEHNADIIIFDAYERKMNDKYVLNNNVDNYSDNVRIFKVNEKLEQLIKKVPSLLSMKIFSKNFIQHEDLKFIYENGSFFSYKALILAKNIWKINKPLVNIWENNDFSCTDLDECYKGLLDLKKILASKRIFEDMKDVYEKIAKSEIRRIYKMNSQNKSLKDKKLDIYKKLELSMSDVIISVIIPVYNVKAYLRQCIESICNQTFEEIEILCINDGSTDGSLDILYDIQKEDKRIRIFDGPNRGYGHAINVGIENAKGKYISIIESDDFILPEMYETMYEVAEKYDHELDMIKSDAIQFYGDGGSDDCKQLPVTKAKLYNRVLDPVEEPDCFNAYMINTTGIYKYSLFERNNIRLNESPGAAFQDNGLWFQLFTSARKIMFIIKAFYMYRQDRIDSSTNTTTFKNAQSIMGEWKFIYEILNKFNVEKRRQYVPVYILRCFGSLYYHFTRILDEYKLIHLKSVSEWMNELRSNGDLDVSLLNCNEQQKLYEIIENPIAFYYSWCMKNVNNILDNEYKKSLKLLNETIYNYETINNSINHNMLEPKVSVIVPVYNNANHLSECLNSIVNQTLKDIEIICIDDGSTDNSLSILTLYMMKDSRIIVRSQHNSGAGPARNLGLSLAHGEFVAFMDSDDYYPNNDVLETLYSTAKKENVLICGGNIEKIENGMSSIDSDLCFKSYQRITYKDWQKDYGYYGYIYKRGMLIENEICFPAYRRFQDPPFFIRAMLEAEEFYVIPEVVYTYRFSFSNVKWNEEKICDLIRGITDCIHLSRENKLPILHYNSIMRLEKNFKKRIIDYGLNSCEVFKLLVLAEQEIDKDLYNEVSEYNCSKVRLNILYEFFSRLLSKCPHGYIGPNAFKEYMQLKNDCATLKLQILKVKNIFSEIEMLGLSNNIDTLRKDKKKLEEILKFQ